MLFVHAYTRGQWFGWYRDITQCTPRAHFFNVFKLVPDEVLSLFRSLPRNEKLLVKKKKENKHVQKLFELMLIDSVCFSSKPKSFRGQVRWKQSLELIVD